MPTSDRSVKERIEGNPFITPPVVAVKQEKENRSPAPWSILRGRVESETSKLTIKRGKSMAD